VSKKSKSNKEEKKKEDSRWMGRKKKQPAKHRMMLVPFDTTKHIKQESSLGKREKMMLNTLKRRRGLPYARY
jgi:hypothetical protein